MGKAQALNGPPSWRGQLEATGTIPGRRPHRDICGWWASAVHDEADSAQGAREKHHVREVQCRWGLNIYGGQGLGADAVVRGQRRADGDVQWTFGSGVGPRPVMVSVVL